MEALAPYARQLGIIAAALALGAAYVAAIASPNCSFDKLDGSRADRHVRELLSQTSFPLSVMMLVAAAGFFIGGALAAAITSSVTAFGFFSSRWMLAPRKGKLPPGAKSSRKGQRMVSVSFTLMFAAGALVALVLGVAGF
jgi:hypothetical protein